MPDNLPPELFTFAALLDAHPCRTTPARTASRSLPDPVPGIPWPAWRSQGGRDGAGSG
jgi:hypothetical protein